MARITLTDAKIKSLKPAPKGTRSVVRSTVA
jgi:hypothetical protein